MVKKKHIVFRVDGSLSLGYGHIYRCITLAETLSQEGAVVEFITAPLNDDLCKLLVEKNIKFHFIKLKELQQSDWRDDVQATLSIMDRAGVDYDWIIVDHYSLDYRWEEPFMQLGKKLLVIDDLADKKHYCHIYLNQTFQIQPQDCIGCVHETTTLLLGEKYILLRPEFRSTKRTKQKVFDYRKAKVHVFFGSTDPQDFTYQFSNIILENYSTLRLKIIKRNSQDPKWVDFAHRWQDKIQMESSVTNMAENMADCDLAFGAPGMATWERAAVGLPGIYLATHPNQVAILDRLQDQGFCHYMGLAQAQGENFLSNFDAILNDSQTLCNMGKLGMNKIDALGSQRVAKIVMEQ